MATTRPRVPAEVEDIGTLRRRLDQAYDSLSTEARMRHTLEDRLAARRDLLQQCRTWVPPAIQAQIDKELAT
jgi:hypothetical protein